jgi:probable HAF family extracellular repeat protein
MTVPLLRALTLLLLPGVVGAASFTSVGGVNPVGVTNGGTVVVGAAGRWTAADGWISVGGLVRAVSDDGAAVVGRFGPANARQAFRWTAGTGLVGLGDLLGNVFFSDALGVSGDGSVVVGQSYSSSGLEAFRWTSSGMIGLGDLAGAGFESIAKDASAEGSVVVGSATSASGTEAMRWTIGGGMTGLGDFAGGNYSSRANAVSADGSVVVGYGSDSVGNVAFRWTEAVGMVGLSAPGWTSSVATGVSGDGSKIVGYANIESTPMAFLWTQGAGIESLLDVLVANGATGLDGWSLGTINAISADGNWVVGGGLNSDGLAEYFLANITPIPIPAAAWLSGSALGLMGWMRRKGFAASETPSSLSD